MNENKEVRIIVAGGRDFDDYALLKYALKEYINGLESVDLSQIIIISGTARGADTLGEHFAYNYGIDIRRFPARWDEFGKSAGIIRNCEMANYAGRAMGVLFAFWDGKSRGTKHMIEVAKKRGLEVHVVEY
jgi:hypothetical protein